VASDRYEKAQEAAQRDRVDRDHRYALALKHRCARAKQAATSSASACRVSIDRAYLAARGVEDECAEDAIPIQLDVELAQAVEARRRCESACRRAIAAAAHIDARGAERHAAEAGKFAHEAAQHVRQIQRLAREAKRDA
jgi:hypothetical protein